MLGTIQSALVLGQVRDARLGEFLSNPLEDKGACEEWFVDDGQVFGRPFQFDPFLRALDGALATFGATLWCAAHGNVKRSARLLCPPERQHEFQGWDTLYVHDTVDVLAPEAGTTALGSAFGSREHINAGAWESVRAFDEMRSATGSVDHAPTEMVLTRQCAGRVSALVTTCASTGTCCIRICWWLSTESGAKSSVLSSAPAMSRGP